MSIDNTRRDLFRRWLKHTGGMEAASASTGISPRTLQRFFSGKQPLPNRFHDEIAAELQRVEGTDA